MSSASELSEFVVFPQLPTGRVNLAFQAISTLMARFDEVERPQSLIPLVSDTLALNASVAELEQEKRDANRSTARYGARAPALDALLGRQLAGVNDILGATISSFGKDSERGRLAARVQAGLFPLGIRELIFQNYVEELRRVGQLLDVMRTPGSVMAGVEAASPLQVPENGGAGMADDIDVLGLRSLVDEIGVTHSEFSLAIRERVRGFDHSRLRQARAERQQSVLRYIAAVLGQFGGSETRDQRYREVLLAPLIEERDDLRAYRRNRRRPLDVDSETGEPVVDDDDSLDVDDAQG